jgi:hypothetical protein
VGSTQFFTWNPLYRVIIIVLSFLIFIALSVFFKKSSQDRDRGLATGRRS